ncbi:MAG: DUF4830 domain-containing protein [Clostridiales bacterium]|nr:DUF4830 domain-containing protein [Clostridiales bacterium]
MFIYSFKASTLKLFGIMALALIVLVSLIIFIPSYDRSDTGEPVIKNEEINYDKIKTNEDRIQFLSQFGWTAESDPEESVQVTIPEEFDKIFTGYNELQKQQGLDLSKYKKKDLMRYTYVITNYSDYEGKVYANLLVYRNKVVGGDICSADPSGFVHGFSAE